MKTIEPSGTVIEKAMEGEAARGVKIADLPQPHSVSWRAAVRPEAVFDKEDLARIAAYRAEYASLSEEISEHSHERTARRFYEEQRTAPTDPVARACLEPKKTMLEQAQLVRRAAKARRGEIEQELARGLVGAAQRLLKLCEAELAELRATEDKLSARYSAPTHRSPLSWALGRSLAPLREALARGSAPLAMLERYVGQVETK